MTAPLIELPPAPRRLRRRPGVGIGPAVGRWLVRLIILPHCIVGIGLILPAIYVPTLLIFGDDVPGVIAGLSTSPAKSGLNYHVHYSYTVDGLNYTDKDTVTAYDYSSTHVGQQCKVRVLQSLPSMLPQRLTAQSPWLVAPQYLLMALLWNAFISIFVWLAWVAPWRTRQLLRFGVPVAGQIMMSNRIRGNKGGVTYQIQYEYLALIDDQNGEVSQQLLNGKMAISVKDFFSAEPGQVVTVLFDPKKPKRSLVYDFAEYQAVE
jgi:hypothetical protein